MIPLGTSTLPLYTVHKLTSRSAPSTRRKLIKHQQMERRIFRRYFLVFLFLVSFTIFSFWPRKSLVQGTRLRGMKTTNEDHVWLPLNAMKFVSFSF